MGYLKEWKDSVDSSDVPDEEKPTMCLSQETQEGLRLTGNIIYPALAGDKF